MASVEIKGLRELQVAIKELPEKLQGAPIRTSLYSGAKLVREHARRIHTWHDDTGFLSQAIVSFPVKKNEHQYTDQVRVGVRRRRVKKPSKKFAGARGRRQRRQKKTIITPYYWRYLEFGTSRMSAKPFLRPAFEAEKSDAAKRITERLREEVEKAANKVRK
jgi:HK97 gp10 family phage protein